MADRTPTPPLIGPDDRLRFVAEFYRSTHADDRVYFSPNYHAISVGPSIRIAYSYAKKIVLCYIHRTTVTYEELTFLQSDLQIAGELMTALESLA